MKGKNMKKKTSMDAPKQVGGAKVTESTVSMKARETTISEKGDNG